MEIEGEDGTKLCLKPGAKAVFGRGAGFNTDDLTVSRRHVSVEFKPAAGETERPDRVSFEVLGRNPVWVRAGGKGEKIRTYRKSETGEIDAGERFCVSGNRPIWFNLKRRDEVTEERDGESGLDSIDISDIDPVKEFGFLVIGKEFNQYPKSRMLEVKQWEWFLEDTRNGNSDDDDDEDEDKKGRKGLSKKRRRMKENEDDNWSAESEEDKDMLVKSKRVVRPTYSTRSKKTKKDTNASSSSRAQTLHHGRVDDEEEEEDEDEDDETMGGFIVSDEDAKLEEEDESDEEEEEEVEDCDEDEDDEE